jgi:hypothetical protein
MMTSMIGNTINRVYHLASRRHATCKNCTRTFASAAEAAAAGFRAPGNCLGK